MSSTPSLTLLRKWNFEKWHISRLRCNLNSKSIAQWWVKGSKHCMLVHQREWFGVEHFLQLALGLLNLPKQCWGCNHAVVVVVWQILPVVSPLFRKNFKDKKSSIIRILIVGYSYFLVADALKLCCNCYGILCLCTTTSEIQWILSIPFATACAWDPIYSGNQFCSTFFSNIAWLCTPLLATSILIDSMWPYSTVVLQYTKKLSIKSYSTLKLSNNSHSCPNKWTKLVPVLFVRMVQWDLSFRLPHPPEP